MNKWRISEISIQPTNTSHIISTKRTEQKSTKKKNFDSILSIKNIVATYHGTFEIVKCSNHEYKIKIKQIEWLYKSRCRWFVWHLCRLKFYSILNRSINLSIAFIAAVHSLSFSLSLYSSFFCLLIQFNVNVEINQTNVIVEMNHHHYPRLVFRFY